MLDESTDIGTNQNLIIYVSFLENYEPVTMFLGLLELNNGSASCLYNACTHFLSNHGLDIQKMICFGSDGASSMIGRHTGLSTRLKSDNPYMTNIHCVAHRASLCIADAVKQSEVAIDIDSCMNAIAALVSKSSLRKSALESLQEEFGCAVLHMSRIHKVRWLSRQIVVRKVCESYEPLLEFTRIENPTIFAKISNFEFKKWRLEKGISSLSGCLKKLKQGPELRSAKRSPLMNNIGMTTKGQPTLQRPLSSKRK